MRIPKLYIVLIIGILLAVFAVYEFNLTSSLSSSDFTMTNFQVVNDKIILKNETRTWSNPTGNDLGPINSNILSGSSSMYIGMFEHLNFGMTWGSTSCTRTYSSYSTDVLYYSSPNGGWLSNDNKFLTSVSCLMPYYPVLEKTLCSNPITTTEKYNHFEVDYTASLNGQTLTPYLLIGTQEHPLINNIVNTADVMSDTQISVCFDYQTSDNTLSPQLENSITLLGSYQTESSSTSSDDSTSNELSIISTLQASSDKVQDMNNNFFSNFDWNTKTIFSSVYTWILVILIILFNKEIFMFLRRFI